MRFQLPTAFALLAAATAVVAETCDADDVLNSLDQLSTEAGLMDTATEVADDNIDHDSPVYKDYSLLVNHLESDLQCNVTIPDTAKQQQVCDKYVEYAANQKESVEVTLQDDFLATNGQQPEAGKVHAYAVRFEAAFTRYTNTVKEGVPSCAQTVEDAYGPVEEDLGATLALYGAGE